MKVADAARQPRLGFDGLFLEHPMTGAGQYATQLWRELSADAGPFEPLLLAPPAPGRLPGKARKIAWEQLGLPRAARQAQAALVHVPYFAAPLRQHVPYIVTVHDVIPLRLPEYGDSAQMRAYLRLVTRATRKARLVLTDSEHARRDIEQTLGVPAERLRVTPLAVSDQFRPAQTADDAARVADTLRRHQLTRPFVLNVGGFDRRKRLPVVVRGFAAALPQLQDAYDLVIAGAPHTGNTTLYPPLEPLIRELGLTERVQLVGFVSEDDKRDLYRAASAFVFASEYEGFGLTPLEALACGAPVICSRRSSLPEVVGDGGLLIEPEPHELAEALARVLSSPELSRDLTARALAQAATFSWRRTARMTLEAYSEALATPAIDMGARHSCAY
jgi:glycosyltransferase involved in cell wall biosynthesis